MLKGISLGTARCSRPRASPGTLSHFEGNAVVCDSQEEAVQKILEKTVKETGDVVVIRYEGPQGGPGMQEMLYPTSFLKGRGLGRPAP